MELRHLRYFLTVAEEGHFGRAAERLHIVQPALSMQVRALETELGTALFERTSRRVLLTEAGVLFRVEAERTIQQAARAKDVAQRAARGEVGTVRIGFVAAATFAGKLAADVSSFKVAYPEVDLELTELSPLPQVEAVLSGHLDAGYASAFQYAQEQELAVDRIAAWPWILAMRSSHPLVGESGSLGKGASWRGLRRLCGQCRRRWPCEDTAAALGTGAARPAPRARHADRADPSSGRRGAGTDSRLPRDHQHPQHRVSSARRFPGAL
jgi:DNA-binding transcriptional LysR family regulator